MCLRVFGKVTGDLVDEPVDEADLLVYMYRERDSRERVRVEQAEVD